MSAPIPPATCSLEEERDIAALIIGWLYARMNVYSRASVEKLTGLADPWVP